MKQEREEKKKKKEEGREGERGAKQLGEEAGDRKTEQEVVDHIMQNTRGTLGNRTVIGRGERIIGTRNRKCSKRIWAGARWSERKGIQVEMVDIDKSSARRRT